MKTTNNLSEAATSFVAMGFKMKSLNLRTFGVRANKQECDLKIARPTTRKRRGVMSRYFALGLSFAFMLAVSFEASGETPGAGCSVDSFEASCENPSTNGQVTYGMCPFQVTAIAAAFHRTDCGSGGYYVYGSPDVNPGGTGATVDIQGSEGAYSISFSDIKQPGDITVSIRVVAWCAQCPSESPTTLFASCVYHITEDGNCGSGTCGSPSPNPNPPPMGPPTAPAPTPPINPDAAGVIANQMLYSGPNATFKLGLNDPLNDAGSIKLNPLNPPTSLSSPAALYLPFVASDVELATNDTSTSQIITPQGLVNINVINAYEYHLDFYTPANITSLLTNGNYGLTGSPFTTWIVANPDGAAATNRLNITQEIAGATNRVFQYTYNPTNTAWTLLEPDGQTAITTWQIPNSTNAYLTNYFRQISNGTQILSQVQATYQYVPGLNYSLLLQGIGGNGTATMTTNFTYYSSDPTNGASTNLLQRVDYPDGRWEYYEYDSTRRKTVVFSAYGDNSPPAAGAVPVPTTDLCQEHDYFYALNETNDASTNCADPARLWTPLKETVEVPVQGATNWTMQEISRVYRESDYTNGYASVQVCVSPGAQMNRDYALCKSWGNLREKFIIACD